MRSDRPRCPVIGLGTPFAGSGGPAGPPTLMPAVIVSRGAPDRPMDQMMGLQSATARAVALVAEIGRLPALVRARLRPLRGLVDVTRAGRSALLALAPKGR
jgi:hypothetical protein